MNQLLTKENFRQCEICAYHEAGHVLFAYLCGYSCLEVQLIEESNEEGFSSYAMIDYGKDAALASKFIGSNPDIEYFKILSLGEKLESIEVGRRLARIFLGGSVAAAVFNNGGSVHIPLPMQVDLIDLMRVEYIHYVIREISHDKEEDLFIENGLQDALYTLANINIWDTIVDLARWLLQSNQLDKGDIEECLEEHGIIYREGTSEMASGY
ncbi:MAG: hypothetical protein ACJ749_04565 [Flavisolibacter sp.]